MTVTLSRIIIFCGNVNGLKSFYQQNFGLDLIEEIENEWIVLNAGAVEIAFHRVGNAYRKDHIPFRADSNSKLVFEITDDLAGLRERLLANGVLLKEIKSFEGFNYLMCDGEDPEGNIFQLKQLAKN